MLASQKTTSLLTSLIILLGSFNLLSHAESVLSRATQENALTTAYGEAQRVAQQTVPGTPRSSRPPVESSFSGVVVSIQDGDTIGVLREIAGDKQEVRIRLYGIDCPEKSQPFGNRAKEFTSDLSWAKNVTVHVKDVDRYGRLVAEVILPDGRSLNQELVREGYAWWYQHFAPKNKELDSLQKEARKSKKGLWSIPNPTPPWDFRASRQHKNY
ncbi:MAG: thermonuclease family protein [Elusimicrobia bacterium]|nr:thermonuclease family protein [Elusimicrobiota bacterium]